MSIMVGADTRVMVHGITGSAGSFHAKQMLEYGTNVLQIHRDALRPGARVIIVDDVLATGGTVAGTLKLVEQLGAIPVAISFLAELPALGGRARLPDGIVSALVAF